MKRILIMSVGLVVLCAAMASAQTTPPPGSPPAVGRNFVDANGDGICDRFEGGTPGAGAQGRRTGPRDGTGQKLRRGGGQGPGTGAGLGPASGTGRGGGVCDGTGPKGRRGR